MKKTTAVCTLGFVLVALFTGTDALPQKHRAVNAEQPRPGSKLQDMTFRNESVAFELDNVRGRFSATLNGTITVSKAAEMSGKVTVTIGKTNHQIHAGAGNAFKIEGDGYMVDLYGNGDGNITITEGRKARSLSVPAAIDKALADFQKGSDPAAWTAEAKVTAVLLALTKTKKWADNILIVQLGPDGNRDNIEALFGFDVNWCKVGAYTAATVITALAATGCSVLTAGCTVGSLTTLGGMVLPCSGLIGLCAGGTFAGAAAAYEFTLSFCQKK